MKTGRPATTMAPVLSAIKSADGITLAELSASVGCADRVARQTIARLRDKGEPIITRRDKAGQQRYHYEAGATVQRRFAVSTNADFVADAVRQAGVAGIMGHDLEAQAGKRFKSGVEIATRRGLICSRRRIGGHGRRYFAERRGLMRRMRRLLQPGMLSAKATRRPSDKPRREPRQSRRGRGSLLRR